MLNEKKSFQDLVNEMNALEQNEQGVLKGGFSAFNTQDFSGSSLSTVTVTVASGSTCTCSCKQD